MELFGGATNCSWFSCEVSSTDHVLRSVGDVYSLDHGEAHSNTRPGRRLRQVDPMSPFLFDLCTEGLSHQLERAER